MNYATHQNRHLYVVKDYVDGSTKTALTDVGDIFVKSTGAGNEKQLFFTYKGEGGEVCSDKITLKNIDYIKAFNAADMVIPLKKIEVTLDSSVNSGAPVAGQDYLLRIIFRQFFGMSDEDQFIKDVVVRATSAMSTAKDLFDAFVVALNKSFSRMVDANASSNPYLSFAAVAATSASGTEGTSGYVAAQPAKLTITEKVQPWNLGVGSFERVYFDVYPTTIYTGGADVDWGVVTNATPAKADAVVGSTGVGNGTRIADLEWFCMGERGDQYRMSGWPNYIPTKYMVDPTTQYHVLEIHHAFTDWGNTSYRSEKDITIVVPIGTSNAGKTLLNNIIGKINTAAGTTIVSTLS